MTRMYLCQNGTFFKEEMDTESYQATDYSSYGNGHSEGGGQWDLLVEGESLFLVLQYSDGYIPYEITYSSEENRFYLDGDLAYLIEENPYCN